MLNSLHNRINLRSLGVKNFIAADNLPSFKTLLPLRNPNNDSL